MGIYAITGASSGIGAAIGRQLKAQGHYVINISRRAAAEDAADVNISADLAMKAERGRVLEALYAAAPDGLDGFVSCSGVGPTQPADVIVSINYFAAREPAVRSSFAGRCSFPGRGRRSRPSVG